MSSIGTWSAERSHRRETQAASYLTTMGSWGAVGNSSGGVLHFCN